MKYRDLHIDTLRGLACLLLVSYHVVGPNADLGLQISSGFLREFNDLLRYVRMPLFTFLSGIVYAYRPYQSGPVAYTKGKIRRLLFPMLTIGTIFAVVRTMTSTSEEASINFSTIHIYPVAHFWFVEALFIIFIFMIVLESLKAFENIHSAIVVMILACGVHLIGTNIEIFALDGALYLFPFFLGGMILQRFNLVENQPTIIVSLLLVAGLFILGLIATESIHAEPRFTLAGLAVELLLCTALLLTKIQNGFLAKIGSYSYSIYIFHIFFTAANRLALRKIGVESVEIIFTIGLIIGIAGPILIELLFNKTKITRTLFLGKKGL